MTHSVAYVVFHWAAPPSLRSSKQLTNRVNSCSRVWTLIPPMNVNHNIKNMKTAKLGKPYQIIFKMFPNQTYRSKDLNITKSNFNPNHGHVVDLCFEKSISPKTCLTHVVSLKKRRRTETNRKSDFIALEQLGFVSPVKILGLKFLKKIYMNLVLMYTYIS